MKPNESLILRDQAETEAAPFFPDFDLPEIDKAKPKFNYTGERLFRDRPDVYKAVMKLLAEPGVSVRTICRECHVTDHTVRSVAAREKIPLTTLKKEVLANITHGLRLASERVIELMPEASARDALIGVGILGEKMQLLSGDATMRIDIAPKIDFQAAMANLHREAMAKFESLKRAEVINIDSVGENPETKALASGNGDMAPIESVAGGGEAK